MSNGLSLYSALTRLYPAEFRREFGSDLVQNFDDLSQARGPSAAWCRVALDLLVTVPRYRLESVMSTRSSSFTLLFGPVALAVAGAASILTGIEPIAGLVLVLAGVGLLGARRSTIARSLRTPTPDRNVRRQRLLISAASAVVCVVSLIGYMNYVGGDDVNGGVLLAYNAVGVPSMIAAVAFLIAGLLVPRRQTATS